MSLPIERAFSESDKRFMTRALELAERGLHTATPNPRVGCVIVNDGRIVGEGWHQRAGEPHAEINALRDAGALAKGAVVYVTLEPCNHHGRTAPCAEALIDAGVATVNFAVGDPNPQVSGAGAARLVAAGIEVKGGLLEGQAATLNQGFFKRMRTGLPHVAVKMAMSLDGRTAMANGESQWITSAAARAQVQRLRAKSCAIMTGVGTVLHDNPSLDVRESQLGQAVERQPALVVIDRNLKTPVDATIFQSSERSLIFICGDKACQERRNALAESGNQVFSLPLNDEGYFDWQPVMALLAQCGFNEVLVESGAGLAGSLLAQRAIDELHLFVAPKILGATGRPLFDLSLTSMRDAVGVNIVSTEKVGVDWYLNCAFNETATTKE